MGILVFSLPSLGKMPTSRVRRFMVRFAERTSRSDMHPLQQVRAPDLFPLLRREVTEGHHVLSGLVHELSRLGEAFRQ